VFLIQNTQNRDGAAIQAKLDELIRTSAAQNVFIGIEHLTEEELDEIRKRLEDGVNGDTADRMTKAAQKAQRSARKKAAEAAKRATS
jgi:low affinity Fe/Cu permease